MHVFNMESATEERVEDTVGHDLDMRGDYFVSEGALLVFVGDEEVVRAASVYGAYFGFAYKSGDENSVVGYDNATGLVLK